MDQNVLNLGTFLVIVTASAVSAIAASGLTVMTLLVVFHTLLNSPTALQVAHSLFESFPPQTRELIHVIAQFAEEVSAEPAPGSEASTPLAQRDPSQSGPTQIS